MNECGGMLQPPLLLWGTTSRNEYENLPIPKVPGFIYYILDEIRLEQANYHLSGVT